MCVYIYIYTRSIQAYEISSLRRRPGRARVLTALARNNKHITNNANNTNANNNATN